MASRRIVVATASRHGATAEIGERIARVLVDETIRLGGSIDVEVVDAGQPEAADDADAVIPGSAVYYGRWLPDARRFADHLVEDGSHRPVWLLSSGPVDRTGKDAATSRSSRWNQAAWAREHRTFGGKLDHSSLGRVERMVAGLIKAPDADARPFDEIEHWARSIARQIHGDDDHHGESPP
ncbi:flavodoxin domain-containing protein [Rhodococcoides corynebacterioides]|uniref:flavodoxin domain-containing protein n=1 Tax=Rhodococcoides corynebacterioides TaxID=53972 RepID=UPI000836CA05|nr:flavodoxin domain-containing protein [Rhodococcus corynebacterioides]